MLQNTLAIIKPDAVEKNVIGKIIAKMEGENLQATAMKMIQLSEDDAKTFYAIHKERPFFMDLVKFMISGPVVVIALQGEDAVAKYRNLMGATNPQEADENTIRKEFATSIDANAVHGSDSADNALIEIKHFFGAA